MLYDVAFDIICRRSFGIICRQRARRPLPVSRKIRTTLPETLAKSIKTLTDGAGIMLSIPVSAKEAARFAQGYHHGGPVLYVRGDTP
jgi:hypothetical protein